MRWFTSWLCVSALLTLGCSGGAGDDGQLLVSAASSLTDAFEELAGRFERSHPGTEVVVNLDSSASLAEQIVRGSGVDVFASADGPNMAEVGDAGLLAGDPVELARNELVMVAQPANPRGLDGVADLASVTDAGEVVALCAEEAPCGVLADQLLESSAVVLPEGRVTRAANARATLGAVTRGDAAAALVYRTDALAAGAAVEVIPLGADSPSTTYLIAPLREGTGDLSLSREFVDLVTSPEGRRVLAAEGFG